MAGCARSTSATWPRAGRSAPPRWRRWRAAVRAAGSHMVLAPDSLAIAEDAGRLGLIAPDAVEDVRARVEERRRTDPPPADA